MQEIQKKRSLKMFIRIKTKQKKFKIDLNKTIKSLLTATSLTATLLLIGAYITALQTSTDNIIAGLVK